MLIAVDADSLCYSHGFPNEGKPIHFAKKSMDAHLWRIFEKASELSGTDPVMKLFIAGEGNFRYDIAVSHPYKGTRKTGKPEHYEGLRDHMEGYYETLKVDGMEADDAVSLLLWEDYQTSDPDDPQVVCVALDKDLKNTPGMHLHPKTFECEYIDLETANKNFYRQLLTGDTADNIKGLPGCGPVSAGTLLDHCHPTDMVDTVSNAYRVWGDKNRYEYEEVQAYFIEQGRLLWMTRELDEDFNPVLWTPPSGIYKEGL